MVASFLFLSGCATFLLIPPSNFNDLNPKVSQLEEKSVCGLTGLRLGTKKQEVQQLFVQLGLKPLKESKIWMDYGSDQLVYKVLPKNPLCLRIDEVVLNFVNDKLIKMYIRIYSDTQEWDLNARASKFTYYLNDTFFRISWLLGDQAVERKGLAYYNASPAIKLNRTTYCWNLGNDVIYYRIDKSYQVNFIGIVIENNNNE